MRPKPITLLRLCRFPTVFTSLADIAAGYLLSHAAIDNPASFLLLLGASSGLYLSGMVFNDVFDVRQDTQERPHRPIPSGGISRKGAAAFGGTLMGLGLLCAALAGTSSLIIAGILAACILAYDSFMKRTPLGPLFMGSCRFFNILLGASTAGVRIASVWQMPQLWMAIAMGIYITGVTWFARKEARVSGRGQLIGALTVIDLGLLMWAVWILGLTIPYGLMISPPGVPSPMAILFLWGVIALTINRRATAAISQPVPERVQPAIGSMLLSVIMIDAMMIYFKLGNPGLSYALGTLALLVPAILLRRWMAMT